MKENDTTENQEESKVLSKEETLEIQVEENKEKYLRCLAELENTKKRLQKEGKEMVKFAVDNVITDFIEPLESLEKALSFKDHMTDEVRNWAFGFEMILSQFKDVLTANGVQPFESIGDEFDPHLHDAIEALETTEHPDGYILQVFVKGYKSGDRIIRPAKVKVAKRPKTQEPTLELPNQNETK